MATKPKAIIESRNGEELSPITIAKNVLTDDGRNLHDILSDRKEDMMTPTIENSSSMFKVGQGDDVDYSANVVNGAYESMVLKGKSMVNCIQESSSQDVVLPYEFEEGQYVTINNTKESGALGVELKGQTLVNLVDGLNTIGTNAVFKDGYITLSQKSYEYLACYISFQYALSENKKYLLIMDVKENTLNEVFRTTTNSCIASGKVIVPNGATGIIRHIMQVKGDNLERISLRTNNGDFSGSITFKPMLIEYQEGMENWDIPYFEGMTSCKMPILSTVGKNLFDGELEKGYIDGSGGYKASSTAVRSINYIGVKPNTNYVISSESYTGTIYIHEYDVNHNHINQIALKSFTTSSNTRYIKFNTNTNINTDLTAKFQIEQNTQSTTYEAYKSSILSLQEEVVLRSLPNGVRDTFNTRTGVYTQRIKEKVLNGGNSESWTKSSSFTGTSCIRFQLLLSDAYVSKNTIISITNDKFPNCPNSSWQEDVEQVNIDIQNKMSLNILKTKLTSEDVSGVKTWLSQNPLTIQYELATPIITKINLPSTLKSWNTTTHLYSEIPENTLYPILSHSNPSYPVILKPSTKYSIVANSYSNSHTNSAINFNLGGATTSTTVGNRVTTITTPSTLSNELLTMSGRGNKLNNVMVIEGDVVGDEPYFEGICDSKSPILSNVGKNLCDLTHLLTLSKEPVTLAGGNMGSTTYSEIEQNSIICTTQHANWWQYNIYKMKVKPSTTYHVSWTKEVVTQPTNGANRRHRIYIINSENKTTSVTDGYKTTTLGDGIMYFVIADESDNGGGVGTQSKFTNVQIVEGEAKTTYEPYKSNILSCNRDKIELTEDMFEQGTFSTSQTGATYESTKENNNTRIRSKKLIRVKPSTTYRFKFDSSCQMLIGGYDSNQKCLGSKFSYTWLNEKVFTTPADGHYISIAIRKGSGSSNIVPSEFNSTGLAIWEVDKTIVLRSLPNGVCDTLNVETGEYVQRIGEVLLDGNEEWQLGSAPSDTTLIRFSTKNKPHNVITGVETTSTSHYLIDRFGVHGYGSYTWNNLECAWTHSSSGLINIVIKKDKLVSPDITGFKQWLSQNPTTVQYQFQESIVKTVDLSGYPFSYENGHVILSSGSIEQSLTPKVEYSVVTNRNGQIRSNQKMVERHQKQLDRLQAMILTNLVNTQYEQTLTNLKYDLKNVREEVK